MPEQLLNRPDIITIPTSGKRMTQRVTCCWLGKSDFESRFSKRSLQNGLMKMMSTFFSRHTVRIERGLGRVALPNALERKYVNAGKEWGWQWVFPATGHLRSSSCCRFTACR
jgi:hypothetical protein